MKQVIILSGCLSGARWKTGKQTIYVNSYLLIAIHSPLVIIATSEKLVTYPLMNYNFHYFRYIQFYIN